MAKKATSAKTHRHLSKATKAKISKAVKASIARNKAAGHVTKKTTTKTKKTTAGELGMCAFTAAGLVTGGDALAAFMDYGSPAGGVEIPDALTFMGAVPVPAVQLVPGAVLGLHKPGWDHAVVVDGLHDAGVWVWSWGELYFLTWDEVNGEDAWLTHTNR